MIDFSIQEKANVDLTEVQFAGDWKLRQEVNLKNKWIEVYKTNSSNGANSNYRELSIGDIKFPDYFDNHDIVHFEFSKLIVAEYGQIVASPGKYQKCMYKPASILPYPKSYIKKSIQFVKHWLEENNLANTLEFDKNKMVEGIMAIDVLLDLFIDIDAENLPTDMMENMMKGSEFQ